MIGAHQLKTEFEALRIRYQAGDSSASFAIGRLAQTLLLRLRAGRASQPEYEPLARLYFEMAYQLALIHHAAGYQTSALYWVEQMHATTLKLNNAGLDDLDMRALTLALHSLTLEAHGSLTRAVLVADQARRLAVSAPVGRLVADHLAHIEQIPQFDPKGSLTVGPV